jgi:hypothetical protein
MNLDFNTLAPGQYVTDELEGAWGVTINAVDDGGSGYTPGGAARVFDTNNPGTSGSGDPDLGSPNESCSGGGPGVGAGGADGSLYENCIPLNNVLIIQESDKAEWDDSKHGGYIEFIFTDKVYIQELAILDIDSRPHMEVTITVC